MINKIRLHNLCNMGIKKYRTLGEYVQCTRDSGYTFIDNGAKILGVAHLDTVQTSHKFHANGKRIYSPRFDDRLGTYTLLEALPKMGIKVDVLLTEDEEVMQSTAEFFKSSKQYNWIFQFDRSGIDVVMYQYHNDHNCELLEDAGFMVGIGSYSDICELDHLDCSGFNFGTAYYKNHSLNAYMDVNEWQESVLKFANFYRTNCDTHIPYDPDEFTMLYGGMGKMYDRWDNWYYITNDLKCTVCDTLTTESDDESMYIHGMCVNCCKWLDKFYNRN